MTVLDRAIVFAFALSCAVPVSAAGPARIGLLPFDSVNVSGGSADTQALPKLLRIEMIKGRALTPVIMPAPAGSRAPIETAAAAAAGKDANVSLVVLGTLVDADVTHRSRGASTGGLLSGVGVGGTVDRATARVSLHIDLLDPASANVVDSFDVEGKSTSTGISMDLSTVLGSIDQGAAGWERSPMGKALADAAHKIDEELLRRVPKLVRAK